MSDFLPPGPRRTAAAVAASVFAVVLLVVLVSGPIVRGMAESRAEALGLKLAIRRAGIGLGVVRLSGVSISCPELPGVTAELAHVEVVPGLTGAPRSVRVHGGSVTLHGSAERLESELDAYRAAHTRSKDGADGGRASSLPLSVDGIDVTWDTETKTGDVEHVWGARYERGEDGSEHVGADLARVGTGSVQLEATKATASLERDGKTRKLTSVGAEHVAAVVNVGDESATPHDDEGAPPKIQGAPATTGTDRASRWLELREKLGRAAESASKMLRPGTALGLPAVRFELRHAGQVLNVGPAKAAIERTDSAMKGWVTSGESDGATPIRFDITVPLGGGAVDVGLAGGPLRLAALGVKERDMGLEEVSRTDVEVNGRARLEADGSSVHLSGGAKLSDLSLFEPRLSKEVVRGLRLGASGDADVSLDGSTLRFTKVDVELGKVKLVANGNLDRSEGHAKGSLHLEIPLAACSDMLASVPSGLVPLLAGLEMSGTFAFRGDLTFDSRRPKDTRVVGAAGNGCKITRVPANVSTDRFARPWTRTVLDVTGLPTTIESGPGTQSWVSLFDVSPYEATAVVVCEDANFWTHSGFNQKSIQDSIRDDLTAGRFVRGGSTVTMQLAKNLYLRREKTLSRKLQEAVLTMLLEQSLTKEQILELYLNVIEFAPGLYGIGPAAAHYFHSTPRELSLGQALYLITLLPNPKVQHFKADGTLGDRWVEYLHHLMEIAHKIRRIDDKELATALAEDIHRGVAASENEAAGGSDDDTAPERPDPDGP
ncbi:MAG TPA: transglycosylase domain-containing protein [Polyangiaceae bacterium]|nr:transglycosylase domain-containing protein [Polyangiaceae bacterium]